MGRKEGGSLFHQFITAPGVFVRSNCTDRNGNPMEVSYRTRRNYNDWLHRAADFFKAQGIRRRQEIGAAEIQCYADHLKAEGKCASTIHDYLAPLCKATKVPMKEIEKPIRYGSKFIRSGGGGTKNGGRPGELNAMLGIREDELRRLRGDDIMFKGDDLYVIVRQGKGGKYQEQRVLPEYEGAVRKFFNGSHDKLFRRDEFSCHFDYHGQRRALAMRAYQYYSARLEADPEYRKTLYREIAGQWHCYNKKHRSKLEPLSYFDKPYILRGRNRTLARRQGKPIELDRLVLRAVSVFHLAHWRDKVTVQSYFFDRSKA